MNNRKTIFPNNRVDVVFVLSKKETEKKMGAHMKKRKLTTKARNPSCQDIIREKKN